MRVQVIEECGLIPSLLLGLSRGVTSGSDIFQFLESYVAIGRYW